MGKKGKKAEAVKAPPVPAELVAAITHLAAYVEPGSALPADAQAGAKAEEAARAIGEFAAKCEVQRHDIGSVGAIPPLVGLLARPGATPSQREYAARALSLLASNAPIVYGSREAYTPELASFDHVAVMDAAGAIAPLVRCVGDAAAAPALRGLAALTLSHLANTGARRSAIAAPQQGALPALLALARGASEDALAARHAVLCLGSLAFCHVANQKLLSALKAEPLLMELAESAAPPGLRQAAAYALRSLTSAPAEPPTAAS